MKGLTPNQQIEKLSQEYFDVKVTWECPCCANEYELLTNNGNKKELGAALYEQGARFKVMKYMSGVFCENCLEDEEVNNSSL